MYNYLTISQNLYYTLQTYVEINSWYFCCNGFSKAVRSRDGYRGCIF